MCESFFGNVTRGGRAKMRRRGTNSRAVTITVDQTHQPVMMGHCSGANESHLSVISRHTALTLAVSVHVVLPLPAPSVRLCSLFPVPWLYFIQENLGRKIS